MAGGSLQHLFPLPEFMQFRAEQAAKDGYLAAVPLQVPADMKNAKCACCVLISDGHAHMIGSKGVVIGGEVFDIYLRDEDGYYSRHSHGYDKHWANSEYFRGVVGA
jgi:hypothetical protein